MNTSRGPLIAEAAANGRRPAFDALLSAGAFSKDPRAVQAAFDEAVQRCRPEILAEILRFKPDLSRRSELNGGRNPLEVAQLCGDEQEARITSLLLGAGAKLDLPGLFNAP